MLMETIPFLLTLPHGFNMVDFVLPFVVDQVQLLGECDQCRLQTVDLDVFLSHRNREVSEVAFPLELLQNRLLHIIVHRAVRGR